MSKSPLSPRGRLLLVLVVAGGVWFLPRKSLERPHERMSSSASSATNISSSASPNRAAPKVVTPARSDRAVFTFAEPANAAELDHALPAPARAIHYVRLNASLITGKRSPFWQNGGTGRVEIPLPDGGALVVAIDGSEMLGPDRFTSTGHIEGRPQSHVVFAWNAGFLHASVDDPEHGRFALRAATAEFAQFYQIDPALMPACGGVRRPHDEPAPRRAANLGTSSASDTLPLVAAAENPQRADVHLLMAYTPAVLPTLTGTARAAALQSAFDAAIAKVNVTFERSLITARIRLVGVVEARYNENVTQRSDVQDGALTALYQEDDGNMDEIHALRDQLGADVVCLALNQADTSSIGLSFLLDERDDPVNARFAFSVVHYPTIAGTNVVAHELGHVFGCAHDRDNAVSGEGVFSFSYGHRFYGADGRQYHDIMAYPPGTEVSYFSNPDVVLPAPISAPVGVAAGRPGEANTALTIERTAFATAAYRLQTQAAANRGSLINVATRAFVGTGDAVLIGGFVVQGSGAKRILVRAAGPALTGFGVTDALANPALRVFAGGALEAENDDWMVPVGASAASGPDIGLAASQASAFSFASGSADAALLVTLPPGAYSAVVEGSGGTTGTGLVEAYEIGVGAARIVNLATRGYAARDGKEMVGGFVVAGNSGETKRVLVRVLGPTLGRAPFNMTGTLDDPELELRNAAGEILLVNDDWSSGAEGGENPENDFRPLVELHGEKQIFATGLAPKNRREPCVLLDLVPGNYTVIVRPFELRSANPLFDQPAVPGVGVVEVYEIER